MNIVDRRIAFQTRWFSLVGKTTDDSAEPYYSIDTLDYVCVVPITSEGEIVLVSQYRPAVEATVLELPAGHVEQGETPEEAARRELLEETGYAAETLELLGILDPDTARLSNQMWCYLAPGARREREAGDSDIEVLRRPVGAVDDLLASGDLRHALHLAALFLAARHLGPQTFGVKGV